MRSAHAWLSLCAHNAREVRLCAAAVAWRRVACGARVARLGRSARLPGHRMCLRKAPGAARGAAAVGVGAYLFFRLCVCVCVCVWSCVFVHVCPPPPYVSCVM